MLKKFRVENADEYHRNEVGPDKDTSHENFCIFIVCQEVKRTCCQKSMKEIFREFSRKLEERLKEVCEGAFIKKAFKKAIKNI
jgi:hypothetical protein